MPAGHKQRGVRELAAVHNASTNTRIHSDPDPRTVAESNFASIFPDAVPDACAHTFANARTNAHADTHAHTGTTYASADAGTDTCTSTTGVSAPAALAVQQQWLVHCGDLFQHDQTTRGVWLFAFR